jgi:hypothetical protein
MGGRKFKHRTGKKAAVVALRKLYKREAKKLLGRRRLGS